MPVIIVTAFATTETAIEAMNRGQLKLPYQAPQHSPLSGFVAKAVEVSRLRHVPAVYAEADSGDEKVDRIVGSSPKMQEVFKAIGRAAAQDVTVLILGESGTGKELIARALYQHSHRKDGPFLALNCPLFRRPCSKVSCLATNAGHLREPTGDASANSSRLEKGTLLLDEIGDMSPATQGKVLRLLQERHFERLGGNETIKTDVRVIAATNKDLKALVATGRFREDLYYRLNVFVIKLPPLRERLEDLPLLVNHFIKIYNRELNKKALSVASEVMSRLKRHSWPGNVRSCKTPSNGAPA